MKNEERLLIDLCKLEQDFTLESYMPLDWKNLLVQSVEHRVAGVVYKRLCNSHQLPSYAKKVLEAIYTLQHRNNFFMLQNFFEVIGSLQENDVNVVALKGVYLVPTIYKDFGLRRFDDLDLIVDVESLEKAKETLRALGFVQGYFDSEKKCIVPASAEELDKHINQLQHEYEFRKCVILEGVPYILKIDLHSRFTTSRDYAKFNIAEMLSRKKHYLTEFGQAYSFDNEDMLIHLCYHNHWHSRTLQDIAYGSDISLKSYMDIREFIRNNEICWGEVIDRCREMDVIRPVGYSLYNCYRIFNEVLPLEISQSVNLDDIRTESLSITDIWLNTDERITCFSKDVVERMFDLDRLEQVVLSTDLKRFRTPATEPYYKKFVEDVQKKQK